MPTIWSLIVLGAYRVKTTIVRARQMRWDHIQRLALIVKIFVGHSPAAIAKAMLRHKRILSIRLARVLLLQIALVPSYAKANLVSKGYKFMKEIF